MENFIFCALKKMNLKILFKELSQVKNQLPRILNFLDFNHGCNIILTAMKNSSLNVSTYIIKTISNLTPGYEVNLARF